MDIFRSWILKICFYIVVAITIVLSLASFYGLMAYLLPIKIALALLLFLFQVKKKKFFSKNK